MKKCLFCEEEACFEFSYVYKISNTNICISKIYIYFCRRHGKMFSAAPREKFIEAVDRILESIARKGKTARCIKEMDKDFEKAIKKIGRKY